MKKIKFDEALGKLEDMAQQLENGSLGLEEAVKVYEKGMNLAVECRRLLTEAESRIRVLSEQEDGTVKAEALDLDVENPMGME